MATARAQHALLALAALSAARAYTPTPHGVLVALSNGAQVELAVEGAASFRVSIANGTTPAQIPTLMISPKAAGDYAPFTVSSAGTIVNLSTAFGSVAIDTASGILALADAAGAVLTRSVDPVGAPPSPPSPRAARNDTCAPGARHAGTDVTNPQRSAAFPNGLKGATADTCCAACNSDPTCVAWVWSDGSHPDPAGNCWPLANYGVTTSTMGRVLGGFTPPPPPPPPGTTAVAFTVSAAAQFYGAGADMGSSQSLTRTGGTASVNNRGSFMPGFWASDGFTVQAVSPFPNTAPPGKGGNVYPVSWDTNTNDNFVKIFVLGGTGGTTADIYLTPAPTLAAHVAGLRALQGAPAILPRYAFGFLACRWGWTNQSYIEGVLAEFRSGNYPIDAFISDFEWYTKKPDYSLPSSGDPAFTDFKFNNITWPGNPADLVARYKAMYNMRFGGIRKPRLGNSASLVMAASKGWLMGQGGVPGAPPDGSRNLNYSHANGVRFNALNAARARCARNYDPNDPTLRAPTLNQQRTDDMWSWYTSQNNYYLTSGVAFFWNDEGESDYLTFNEWAAAESAGLAAFDASRRYWSIDRAYAPGAARLGAIVWTGDIQPSWDDLQKTPGLILNWGLSGAPFVTCDTGGFSGETNSLLLARWYGASAFSPVMRVHSTLGSTPHFPFPELWGADASAAMRALLELRYALIPHLYSLAHETYATGLSLARPMVMHFPDAATAALTSQWLIGDALLVAPVLTPDNATSAVLPALAGGARWFEWGSAVAHAGGQALALTAVPLDAVPAYARSGGIFALAPPVQYSDALPGGPLDVRVYAGADGAFTLYEDDGETTAYATGAVAKLALSWEDAAGCLSWARGGAAGAGGANAFTQLRVTAYFASGATKAAAAQAIGASGRACPA